jgi:hypothetical protein
MEISNILSPCPYYPPVAKMPTQELQVAKGELTSGNTTGEVYVQSSKGAAFLLADREKTIEEVEKKLLSRNLI